ncbi:uncharacterized protein BJX67DRAFT_391713 [Aspergillus lucknowensis]|uniref:F-box domain-containing protein n=1 Tax=Aspergillus lucknowensis TaxID=176173 RepID=A0ABR4LYP3_9EURO
MASGTAYRWKHPGIYVLNLYDLNEYEERRKGPLKLYEAPASAADATVIPVLHQLPNELVQEILVIPPWFLLRKHATDTLRIMDATKCTSYFPIRWLFKEFCHPRCRTCTDFGLYLYLPTISRCCFNCTISRSEYRVAPTPDAMWHFGLSRKQLKSIPIIYPLPSNRKGKRMVDVWQAERLGIGIHGSLQKMKRLFLARVEEQRSKEEMRDRKWEKEGCIGRAPARRLITMNLVDGVTPSNWRLKGTTSFPYWNRQTAKLEPGVYCRACTYDHEEMQTSSPGYPSCSESRKPYYRAYLESDMPEHFLHCPAVKKNYNFKKRGYISPLILFCRRGTDFYVDVSGAAKTKRLKRKIRKTR